MQGQGKTLLLSLQQHSFAHLQPAGKGLVLCQAGAPLVAQLGRLRQPQPGRLYLVAAETH